MAAAFKRKQWLAQGRRAWLNADQLPATGGRREGMHHKNLCLIGKAVVPKSSQQQPAQRPTCSARGKDTGPFPEKAQS